MVQKTKSRHTYKCPTCGVSVKSSKTDGRIRAERHCGHTFTVAGGQVVAKPKLAYTYKCPACQARVSTKTRDGIVDNRRTCGHQFKVAGGVLVRKQKRKRACQKRTRTVRRG